MKPHPPSRPSSRRQGWRGGWQWLAQAPRRSARNTLPKNASKGCWRSHHQGLEQMVWENSKTDNVRLALTDTVRLALCIPAVHPSTTASQVRVAPCRRWWRTAAATAWWSITLRSSTQTREPGCQCGGKHPPCQSRAFPSAAIHWNLSFWIFPVLLYRPIIPLQESNVPWYSLPRGWGGSRCRAVRGRGRGGKGARGIRLESTFEGSAHYSPIAALIRDPRTNDVQWVYRSCPGREYFRFLKLSPREETHRGGGASSFLSGPWGKTPASCSQAETTERAGGVRAEEAPAVTFLPRRREIQQGGWGAHRKHEWSMPRDGEIKCCVHRVFCGPLPSAFQVFVQFPTMYTCTQACTMQPEHC